MRDGEVHIHMGIDWTRMVRVVVVVSCIYHPAASIILSASSSIPLTDKN